MDAIYLFVFGLIAIVVVYYFFFTKDKNKPTNEFTRDDSSMQENRNKGLSIEFLGIGGKIAVSNFGVNDAFLNVTIQQKTTYQEGDNFWFELEGNTSQGDDFWLQIESIEPLLLNGGTERVDFNEIGLSTRDLEELRNGDRGFQFQGETFFFETNGEVKIYNNEEDERYDDEENDFRWCRYWEFTNEAETIFVSVDQFEDGSPEVSVSYPIQENNFKIFELGQHVE